VRCGDYAPPARRPFTRRREHPRAELASALGSLVDLVDLDIGNPERPSRVALDDPAAQTAAEVEGEIGATPRIDQLRSPPQQPLVVGARGRPIARVPISVIPAAITGPGEMRVTSSCENPTSATEVSDVASHATPVWSGSGGHERHRGRRSRRREVRVLVLRSYP
jgi:hypothetical protein